MHTHTINNTTFTYNSDLSGYLYIRNMDGTLRVSGEDLINFVIECFIKPEMINNIENASTQDIINLIIKQR